MGGDQPAGYGAAGDERARLIGINRDAENSAGGSAAPPSDRWNAVYLIMFLQGMGMLFGWNMFITAVVYFQDRLVGSNWHDCVENYVTFAFQVCNVGVQLLLTAYPQDVVFPMLVVNTLVMAACLVLVYLNTTMDVFFAATIACACLAGVTCAGVSAGVYGIGGTMPPSHTQAIMSGQALGGIIVAVSSVLFGFLPQTPTGKQEAAAGYFIVAVVVLLACTATILILPKLPFMAFYRVKAATASASEALTRSQTIGSQSLFASTFSKVKGLGFWVGLNFLITLSVFPAVTADVKTYSFGSHPAMWVGLYCFLLFNCGDWMGRMLAGWAAGCGLASNGIGLRLLILLRLGFLPLFMLCNHETTRLPIVFTHDAYPILFMALFAVTNGYAGTVCMMTAPALVSDGAGMQAGTIMASCLVLGIVLGSTASFGVKFAYTGTDPFCAAG